MRKVRGAGAGSGDSVATERRRLLAAQAEKAELFNAQRSGELISTVEVTRIWSGIVMAARTALLALPSRCKARLPHLTVADLAVIDALIRHCLVGLADGRGDVRVEDRDPHQERPA